MGMAASQARFLGLTARLNNCEFEAQQIHQQRTSLSNKSASYYSDLLGLSVPTAPSVDAFTQTVYTFDDGALTNQITSMIANSVGTYTVSYIRSWTDDNAVVSAPPSIITQVSGSYKVGAQFLRYAGSEAYNPHLEDDPYYQSLTQAQQTNLITREDAQVENIRQELGLLESAKIFVRYIQNTTTNEYEPVFYVEDEVTSATYDTNGNSISNINAYKFGSKTRSEEVLGVSGCMLEQDSTGRYMNITIPTTGGGSTTYSLTTNTVTDQDAYEDAMNQYEYDKALYDQAIADINAKIEIVQSEDKNLELRLKQLDTEHNAIQTERDQVKELIKKNVDSSFKTFG